MSPPGERRIASSWLRAALLVLLPASTAAVVASCGPSSGTPELREPFDKQLWLERGGAHSMCADLQANHLRAGMSRAQVLELLGPPDIDTPDLIGWDVGGPIGEHFNVLLDSGQRVERIFLEMY
jgi:hypothetical protein